MRIVSGEYRGRTIDAPQGEGTRPTTDRVREAMMSSVASLIGGFEGTCVLDAFAGSGALGIEALSRGAHSALFFESDRNAQKVIARNLKKLGVDPARGRLVGADVMKSKYVKAGKPFDLVFFDPPYALPAGEVLAFAQRLFAQGALAQDVVIVYEHALASAREVGDAARSLGFTVAVAKKYGKTGVSMLQVDSKAVEGGADEQSVDTGNL